MAKHENTIIVWEYKALYGNTSIVWEYYHKLEMEIKSIVWEFKAMYGNTNHGMGIQVFYRNKSIE